MPYALSLRPGAFITATMTSPALNLQNNGGGRALNISTRGDDSTGIYVSTRGRNSEGIVSVTALQSSEGVYAQTSGQYSRGVNVSTTGDYSEGIRAETAGLGSYGVAAETAKDGSYGLFSLTHGENSHGIRSSTSGDYSDGVSVYTTGLYSEGFFGRTDGEWSDGAHVLTFGPNSDGYDAITYDNNSIGLFARTYGSHSYGVYAMSNQSYGVWGDTNRNDHQYGFYTQDYLYAKGTQYPAVDVAEYLPIRGDVAAGTVLVIGEDSRLQPPAAAYDSRVAGIVSTDPGIFLGTKESGNAGEALIAIAGRVPCRVDASYQPIRAGDLLTTSGTPGHVMRAEPDIVNGHAYPRTGPSSGRPWGASRAGQVQSMSS